MCQNFSSISRFLVTFIGLSLNQNFDPERISEQNSQFFFRIRNSSRISRRPGIRPEIWKINVYLKKDYTWYFCWRFILLMEFKFGNEKIRNIVCSYIFGVVLFQTLGQTRNPEFRPEFPVANFPEQNRNSRKFNIPAPDIQLSGYPAQP